MKLFVEHVTSYEYDGEVRNSKNEARMTPAETERQTVDSAGLVVDPAPLHRLQTRDYFGTIVESFEVLEPHTHLRVTATAFVETHPPPDTDAGEGTTDPWAVEYLFPSPMVSWGDEVVRLATSLQERSTVATVHAAMKWLHSELTYEPGSTVVGTPVTEVIRARRGVCQDYAHTCCALLRALHIPARYVSGYFVPRELEPGESAEAQSHAWVEAFLPLFGWWAIDPTNDVVAGERHVKVGHGRDYSDVIPFHGVHAGAADQRLDVGVEIRRLG